VVPFDLWYVICNESYSQSILVRFLADPAYAKLIVYFLHRLIPGKPIVKTFTANFVAAVGCSNLIPPEDAWIKREDDKIIVGCYTSRQTWQLRCHDGRWTGVVSNCSTHGYSVNRVIVMPLTYLINHIVLNYIESSACRNLLNS